MGSDGSILTEVPNVVSKYLSRYLNMQQAGPQLKFSASFGVSGFAY